MRRIIGIILAVVVGLFLLIQLIPFGRQHSNPPVTNEVKWSSPQAQQLARRACYDCHSNETVWPWYSNVAPMSWLLENHVVEGREKLNFSDWRGFRGEGEGENSADEVGEVVLEGEMPPGYYIIMHLDARLTTEEKQILVDGLNASLTQK